MSKVFIYNDLYLATFPLLELPLFYELKSKGIDVNYIIQEGDIRLLLPEIAPSYQALNPVIIKKTKEIPGLLKDNDLLIQRFCYKGTGGDVAASVRSAKRRILMLDPAAIDLKHRECVAQWITAKSEWMKQQVLKKFPGRYKDIFAVGTIHFDEAEAVKKNITNQKQTKEDLMRNYGLDTKKKLAILCKSSQGEIGHQKGVDDEYKQIVKIVASKCPDYELLFKCHPVDYLSQYNLMPGIIHKNEHYNNKPSWQTLFPDGIKVLEPSKGYVGFYCADVVLNVRSSIGMETPLFPTPILNINRDKYLTNWPKSANAGVMKDIEMKYLADTLNNSKYYVDKEACKEYVLKYCDPCADGLAYKRTADVTIKILGE